jgi:alcohol dehydrogenase class IV
MGAIAFQKGLGLVHSCAHALSTVTDMHHGTANAVMIDHALKFNVSEVPERFKVLCEVVGLKEKSGKAFLKWLKKLKKQVGMPASLSKMGVKKEQIDALVKVAIADGCHALNPRKVTAKDFQKIFKDAM